MKPRLTTNRILITCIALLLILIATIIVVTISQSTQINDAAKRPPLTNEVNLHFDKLMSFVLDYETGLKNYQLTGEPKLLISLEVSKKGIYDQLAQLKAVTRAIPAQQVSIDSLSFYLDEETNFNQLMLSAPKPVSAETTQAPLKSQESIYFTKNIRQVIEKIRYTESLQSNQRGDADEIKRRAVNLPFKLVIIGILVLLVVFIQKVRIDLSEKKKAATRLEKQHDQLEQIVSERTNELEKSKRVLGETFDRVTDAFVALDQNWCYTYMNKKAGEIFGRDPGQMIGKHMWTEFPDAVNHSFFKAYRQAMETQQYLYSEEYYFPKDGWFGNHIYPSPDGLSIFHNNITEKKKAALALKESEEKYRTLVNQASDGIFIADKNGKYEEVNDSACKTLGYSKEEIYTLYIKDLVVMDEDSVPFRFEEIIAGKTVIQQRKLRRKDGTVFPVEISARQLPGGRMLGMVRDMTERFLAEQRLQREKELSDKIINSLPGLFYLSDPTPRLLRWNKTFEKISGYSPEELEKIEPITLFEPGDQLSLRQSLDKTYQTGVADVEARLLTKNGQTIPFYFTGVRIEYEGNPAVLGTGIDISELKKAEEKTFNAEKRFRALIENSTDGLTVMDESGTILEMSPTGKKILGYDPAENINLLNPGRIHPEDERLHLTAYQAIIHEPAKIIHIEYRHKMPDGSYKWLESSYHNLLNEPAIRAIVLNYRDITERKNAEEQIIKEKELSETIINNLPGIFYLHDESGKFIRWNKNFEKITGYNSYDIVNMNLVDFYDTHQQDLIRKGIRTAFEKEIPGIELTLLTKQYHKIPFLINYLKIDYEGRKCLVGMGIDLSDNKKSLEEIKKSNERFELIGKATNDAIWELNLETNEVWGNETHQQLYGLTLADPVPDDEEWKKRIHQEDREQMVKTFDDALASEHNSFYTTYRFHAGNKGWMNVFGSTYIERNKEGKAVRLVGSMMDITKRIKAEEALLNTEKRLQFLLSSTPAVIYSSQTEFPFAATFVSENIQELTGYTPEEFMNHPNFWANHIHPDDKEKVMKDLVHLFEQGHHTHEYRFRMKEGNYLWMHDEVKLIFDASGKTVEMVGYWINIDERKKTEQAIQESEEKYRTLVEQASDGILITDEQGRIITVNTSGCNLSGYSREELSHMTIFDFVSADDLKKSPFQFDELKLGKTVFTERVVTVKNGKSLYVELNAKLLPDGRLLAFVRDISVRKKVERALAESENYLRTIVQTEPECIKLLNINGELEDMNPAGLAIIEADSLVQVKGKPVYGIISKVYREAFKELTRNVFLGKSGTLEFEITGLKGTRRLLETHAVPLKDPEGKILSLLGVSRDITIRKKAEIEIANTTEQLRQLTTHLQDIREEERKRIGREIHDELGQQLTAIKMDIAWIDKKTPEETVAIKTKLKNVITLLDGSNLSIRRILSELRPVILDDNGLLDAIEWLGIQFTSNTGIPVKFITPETQIKYPEPVATCIFRVYQEAFTNITRYAQANKVSTSLTIIDDTILVVIEDDGKGFDTATLKNKTSFGILGMKERVFSLDGRFELISSPGKGTKISIRLPVYTSIHP